MLLTRKETEILANARSHTRKVRGYWKTETEFIKGEFYLAFLGKQHIFYPTKNSIKEARLYQNRQDAFEGAKQFRNKMRQRLILGEYLPNKDES